MTQITWRRWLSLDLLVPRLPYIITRPARTDHLPKKLSPFQIYSNQKVSILLTFSRADVISYGSKGIPFFWVGGKLEADASDPTSMAGLINTNCTQFLHRLRWCGPHEPLSMNHHIGMSHTVGKLSFSPRETHNQNSCPPDFGLAVSLHEPTLH